jgi:hypothetical protein
MPKVIMEIPPARATQIAQLFRDEGLEVSWDGPMEKRAGGVEEQLVQIVYFVKANAAGGVVGGASYALVQAAVRKLRQRFPSVRVTVEDDGEDSVEDV